MKNYLRKANHLLENLDDDFVEITPKSQPKTGPFGRKDLTFDPQVDQIGQFWIVTEPTKVSTLADICFECDIGELALQFRGGLEISKIVGVFKNGDDAKRFTNNLLKSDEIEI